MIDCNANLGPFPFRRIADSGVEGLLREMDDNGIERAWVGSLETILHLDTAPANDALASAVSGCPDRLLAQPTINLWCDGWEREYERCTGELGARMVRIYPNYHGYRLDDERVLTLAASASESKVLVTICLRVYDERSHPACCPVPAVDLAPLGALVGAAPATRFVLMNAYAGELYGQQELVRSAANLRAETSHLDGVDVIGAAARAVGASRLLTGTYAPVFYTAAAPMKLTETDLTAEELGAIASGNAAGLVNSG